MLHYLHKHKGKSKTAFSFMFFSAFIVLSLLLGSCSVYGQAYYYFVNEINSPVTPVYTYKTFLTLQPDGNATARIQYNDAFSNELFLVELNLTDSTDETSSATTKYLVANSTPKLIVGSADTSFLMPRFIFIKKYDSLNYYYEPVGTEIKMPGGTG